MEKLRTIAGGIKGEVKAKIPLRHCQRFINFVTDPRHLSTTLSNPFLAFDEPTTMDGSPMEEDHLRKQGAKFLCSGNILMIDPIEPVSMGFGVKRFDPKRIAMESNKVYMQNRGISLPISISAEWGFIDEKDITKTRFLISLNPEFSGVLSLLRLPGIVKDLLNNIPTQDEIDDGLDDLMDQILNDFNKSLAEANSLS